MPHTMTRTTSPIDVTLRCSCGWSHRESRRQNALAREAKLGKAARKHLQQCQTSTPRTPKETA